MRSVNETYLDQAVVLSYYDTYRDEITSLSRSEVSVAVRGDAFRFSCPAEEREAEIKRLKRWIDSHRS